MMPTQPPRVATVMACVLITGAAVGCGTKRPETVFPPAVSRDAIERARDMLELYAAGQQPGSEAEGFATMVADVRAVDAGAAATLDAGLAEIAASPRAAAATARRLLGELPTSAAGTSSAAGTGPAP